MTAEEKMFYMFAGVAARCGVDKGGDRGGDRGYGSLISLDRPSALDGEYLNQFPILDYFRQKKKYNPITGEKRPLGPYGKPIAFTEEEFEEFWHHWREEGKEQVIEENAEKAKKGLPPKPLDYYNYHPCRAFAKFLWEEILLDPSVRVRLSKGLRAARKMDHDDTHMFIPPGAVPEIETITKGPAGGGELNFTPEGYANAYPGYNQFWTSIDLRMREKPKEVSSLVNTLLMSLQGFVTYDAIMDNRLHKREGLSRARLSAHHYDKTAVVDSSCNVRLHQTQLRSFVKAVVKAYGLKEPTGGVYGAKTMSIKDERSDEFRKQQEYERELQDFVDEIPEAVKEQGSGKLIEILDEFVNRGYEGDGKDENCLRGLRGSKRPKTKEEEETEEHVKAA